MPIIRIASSGGGVGVEAIYSIYSNDKLAKSLAIAAQGQKFR
ncbi:hypothetical protein NW801_00120 [Brevibacillus laterosporus]|uniref:Uncharacterized protein n=1 Tax=Brevibacillus halotolerans TaxID=1507437 RepID=A0ABT4HQZ0_9BACL|nr:MULTISPECIES: hypothetical protein [Brevibacillus]MCR8983479.1 hypothetical protein [Brevibacillus laterosporus]MCZ0829196.1 hypothetical protein [Brevibacillus halotolerans]